MQVEKTEILNSLQKLENLREKTTDIYRTKEGLALTGQKDRWLLFACEAWAS